MAKGGFTGHVAQRLPGTPEGTSDIALRLVVAWSDEYGDLEAAYGSRLFEENINKLVRQVRIEFNRRFANVEPKRVIE